MDVANDLGYWYFRFAGTSIVFLATKLMREQNLRNALKKPMDIGVCIMPSLF